MTKSSAAYLMTVDKLADQFKNLYFWTFTFVHVVPDWDASTAWSYFIRDMQDHYNSTIFGIKVTELHADHGLHFHCVFNRRVSVHILRRIGARYGFGRMQVAKVRDRKQLYYLAKYLGKTKDRWFAGAQKWHTVGGFKGVKVSDIEKIDAISIWKKRIYKDYKITFTEYMCFRSAVIDGNWKAVRMLKMNHMRRMVWEKHQRINGERHSQVVKRRNAIMEKSYIKKLERTMWDGQNTIGISTITAPASFMEWYSSPRQVALAYENFVRDLCSFIPSRNGGGKHALLRGSRKSCAKYNSGEKSLAVNLVYGMMS